LDTGRKYKKPKILLVDLEDSVHQRLESMGLNVRKGTFGRPYEVGAARTRDLRVVQPNAMLPNLHEQEIVIVDLTEPEVDPNPPSAVFQEMNPPDQGFCLDPSVRIVNPRFVSMLGALPLVERMLLASGVLVVFLQPPMKERFTPFSFDRLSRHRLAGNLCELGNLDVSDRTRRGGQSIFPFRPPEKV